MKVITYFILIIIILLNLFMLISCGRGEHYSYRLARNLRTNEITELHCHRLQAKGDTIFYNGYADKYLILN